MPENRLGWLFLATVLAVAASGCGSGKFVKVKGVVTLDGSPLAGSMITFVPENGKGQLGHGWSKSDGSFALESLNEIGAAPGEYRVVVTKRVALPGVDTNLERAMSEAMKQGKPPPDFSKLTKSVVPECYSDPARTPLRCTVPPPREVVPELHSDNAR